MRSEKKLIFAAIIFLYGLFLDVELSGVRGILIEIKSCVGCGFFAELNRVIANIAYYESRGLKRLVVDWSDEFFPYKDDKKCNGWNCYFDLIQANAASRVSCKKGKVLYQKDGLYGTHILHDSACLDRWIHYDAYFAYRKFFHDKIKKYIKIKKDICDEVDVFYNNCLKDAYLIGVHVRFAKAHNCENPLGKPISLDEYVQEVYAQIDAHKDKRPLVFLSTDSDYVVERFREEFSSRVVCTNAPRAKYDEDPNLIFEHTDYFLQHPQEFHAKKPGYLGGKMTLIDCLLLARCDVMIHSHSNVDQWATFFNPKLKSIFLPHGLVSQPCKYFDAPFHMVPKVTIDQIQEECNMKDIAIPVKNACCSKMIRKYKIKRKILNNKLMHSDEV